MAHDPEDEIDPPLPCGLGDGDDKGGSNPPPTEAPGEPGHDQGPEIDSDV